jgi:hypothetical protein
VEMAEVIGGNFWNPYAAQHAAPRTAVPASGGSGAVLQVGQDPAIFEARPPIDLSNARPRTLATALGPAYIRVSGTWANTVYFPTPTRSPRARALPAGTPCPARSRERGCAIFGPGGGADGVPDRRQQRRWHEDPERVLGDEAEADGRERGGQPHHRRGACGPPTRHLPRWRTPSATGTTAAVQN